MEDLDLGTWNMAKQKLLQFYSGSRVFYADKTMFSYGRHKRYTTCTCICCSTICSFGTIFSELVQNIIIELVQNILNCYNFNCTGLFLSTV